MKLHTFEMIFEKLSPFKEVNDSAKMGIFRIPAFFDDDTVWLRDKELLIDVCELPRKYVSHNFSDGTRYLICPDCKRDLEDC